MSAAMKPILFSTPMVQAILDGRKTMTRRVINPDWIQSDKLPISLQADNGLWHFWSSGEHKSKYCIGDVLWVRETWCKGVLDGDATKYKEYWCIRQPKDSKRIFYKADCTEETGYCDSDKLVKWKPSIFMPKEACRIFLRVTNVRVERLQDITAHDIFQEGCVPLNSCSLKECSGHAFNWWINLWNSINGKGAWEDNPYVFVYEFERVEKPC